MNTKKIWMISLILGITVACFSYLTIFSKDEVSNAASGETVTQEKNPKNSTQTEKKTSDEQKPPREFSNPIVEVSKGKRAISLRVNTEAGVSGYLAQNSKVDVIAYGMTKDDKTGKKYKSAILVLENVKVLASGKSSDNKEEALHYDTVTLEVTTEQGITLSLASKDKDGFYLMLRNQEDTETGKAGIKETREVIKEEDN
ncbi:Flp pilus assembly protein CpaB [Neobacillus cucumis]|uniref:Flp pilus assembly protein CpaB n=1 Tax=Neobacillus cucumis TaxID=1740721 RepID=A0A2N5HN19_9BACI|nr:Flp pilus assembly protein CpaB [Neobacillus cucumis]PLS06925.1 Flp pilus assembly protein CpaB [Neobacillus cucumis]